MEARFFTGSGSPSHSYMAPSNWRIFTMNLAIIEEQLFNLVI
tara:strand:+ start:278 stop:403 length:126 start_codon:yes stop_codon:yes gene_type:complete